MTTASPGPPAESTPDDALVQMSGTSHDSSTFNQVAGDQYNIHLPPKPPSPATCTLPADTAAFTGRTEELHDIAETVTAAAEAGRIVAIHAIDGMPGVGKTALAVHVGHLLADHFPDRQLFLNLHAHTAGQQPIKPEAALASLLTADGVDARYLPDGMEERAALWRDRMAGKQALLILDNAASSGQVAPLLLGSAGCLVLITSRRYLGDLPSAVPVPLDTLPPEDAQQMFLRLAPRAAAEPARVAELVALCGHLPLAISLLASLFSKRRSWAMGHLITETKTLLTVAAENRTVAAAFDLSYQDLPTDRQRFFRRLGLHPGVDIDAYAAAALAGIALDQAREYLDALYRDHLLNEPIYRRYRMHDLIRDYARTLAATDPADERDQALGRLLDYYQHTAALADGHLTRHPRLAAATLAAPPGTAPGLVSRSQALAWMRTELANLLACIDRATQQAQHARVVGLIAGVAYLLRNDSPGTQALGLHATAVAAARHLGNRVSEANALHNLGDMRHLTGDYSGAIQMLEQALSIYRDLGDRLGEAEALNDLGVIRDLTGDYSGAIQMLEQALSLCHDLGNRLGEAEALNDLGFVRYLTGDYSAAVRVLEQALSLCRDIGHRLGEAGALTKLGVVRRETGNYSGAIEVLEQALSLYRNLGSRHGEANALNYLGGVRYLTGDYRSAVRVLEQALGLYRDLGNRMGEANALTHLGEVLRVTGDYPGAVRVLEQALGLYRDLGNRLGEANVFTNMGVMRRQTGDYPGAAQVFEQALCLYRDLGHRHSEAEVLNHSGMLCLKLGDSEQALAHHQRALDLARVVGSPLEQARALEGTGRCALSMGDTATAVTQFRQALEVYQRIGAAEATQLATDLADLDAE